MGGALEHLEVAARKHTSVKLPRDEVAPPLTVTGQLIGIREHLLERAVEGLAVAGRDETPGARTFDKRRASPSTARTMGFAMPIISKILDGRTVVKSSLFRSGTTPRSLAA